MQESGSNKLVDFIVMAKKETYASDNRQNLISSDLAGAVRYEYRRGDFQYVDTYSGSRSFAGMEVVYLRKKIIWSMVYYGGIIAEQSEVGQIYTFLKKALGKVDIARPFRGPEKFEIAELSYTNEFQGDVNRFHGTEHIMQNGQPIYDLMYQGGTIL